MGTGVAPSLWPPEIVGPLIHDLINGAEYRRARAHRVERSTEGRWDSVLSQFYGQAERAISNG